MIGNKLEPFKFWCQKVLPNVYDDSLSYYEYLCKLNEYLNEVIEQINTLTDNMSDYEDDLTAQWGDYKTGLNTEWTDYKTQLTEQWTYYKNYIDHYFDNLDVQTEINNKLDAMVADGTLDSLLLPYFNTYTQEINNKILNLEQTAATPNFVPSTSDMTDTSKFYVLTTNGHIYYYNSSWIDSGLVYGTGVDTFTCGIINADSSSNPYDLNTLSNANKIYIFNGYATNAPTPLLNNVIQGIIITVNKRFSMQVILCSKSFYTRIAGSYPTFGAWSTPLETFATNNLYNYEQILTTSSSSPKDLNTLAFTDTIYEFTGYLTNAPITFGSGIIITTKGQGSSHAYATQTLISGSGTFFRVYGNSWQDWLNSGFTSARLESVSQGNPIDLNSLTASDKIYSINGYFSNAPFTGILQGTLIYVNAAYKTQVLVCNQGVAVRLGTSASNWQQWFSISASTNYRRVYVGSGETYTSIVEALRNETASNIEFYLKKGTYDIEAEYKASYGNDFFSTYDGYSGHTDPMYRGLSLRNGQRLTGDLGAEIVFNPATDYENVQNYFSPLNLTINNIFENIKITIKNDSCRYLIHDDFNSLGEGCNIIRDCELHGTPHRVRSIGGGMGNKNKYILENIAVFTSSTEAIDYHNSETTNPKNVIYMTNIYAPNAELSVTPIGDETYMTYAYITNCKCSGVIKRTTFPSNNITLYAWNNDTT